MLGKFVEVPESAVGRQRESVLTYRNLLSDIEGVEVITGGILTNFCYGVSFIGVADARDRIATEQ